MGRRPVQGGDSEMRAFERRAGSGVGGIVVCVLLLSGPGPGPGLGFYEYHLVNEPMLWYKAKLQCRERFTALATVSSMKDMTRLREAVGGGFQGQVWIGLNDGWDRWKWSLYDPSFYAPGEYDFNMWHAGEPNDTHARGRLCVVSRQGTWFDLDCNTAFPFVCYDENLRVTDSSFGYVLVDQEMSWWDAASYCKTNHTSLASVRNVLENSEIRRLVADDSFVWIGRFRYTWTLWAGDTSEFENWISGHPKVLENSCATSVFDADHAGEWMEMNCRTKLPFVCHRTLEAPPSPTEKKQVFHMKISALESTIDLNDPAVTEAVLDQIREKMEETSISRDFRVSWIKKSNKKIFNKEKKKKKK